MTITDKRHCGSAVLAGCLLAAATGAVSTPAVPADAWTVQGKLLGEPRSFDAKKSEDVSGIACAEPAGFPRTCLVVDDETQGVQVVALKDGELTAGDFIRLIYDTYEDEPVELDAEGVAYADGFFYVIGSHGRPRHEQDSSKEAKNKARAKASQRVFRIGLGANAVDRETGRLTAPDEIKASAALSGLIRALPDLAPFVDQALEDNGLTIEGVAVRQGTLHAGLRGPVLADGNAVIVSVPVGVLFDGQTGAARLHRVNLGKDTSGKPRGIRDLIAYRQGFLIIAGPVNDPPDDRPVQAGDYAIYGYEGDAARKRVDLKAYGKKTKPEALLPLEEKNGRLHALLLFDGPDEGEPTPLEID